MGMQHKISEFCDVIDVMYAKAVLLRREKYEKPKESRDDNSIELLIDDIQSLALQIAHDKQKHPKRTS